MPRLIRPTGDPQPDETQDALAVYGNAGRALVVHVLSRAAGGVRMGDLLKDIDASRAQLARHLAALEEIGLVVVDLPPDERRGGAPRYSLDRDRAVQLFDAFEGYLFPGSGGEA